MLHDLPVPGHRHRDGGELEQAGKALFPLKNFWGMGREGQGERGASQSRRSGCFCAKVAAARPLLSWRWMKVPMVVA